MDEADLFEISSKVRERWEAGQCPCCGCSLGHVWQDGANAFPDTQIAPGILLCGLCAYKEHHLRINHVQSMILTIRVNQPRKASL